ncbi:stage III sporulation protein AG [bacterium LRH843]|nr:stage III sporulation protein AG [bacterium LRH843]
MNHDEQKDQKWLQTLVKARENGKKRRWPLHYVLLLGCAGVALMITGNLLTNPTAEDTSPSVQVFNDKKEDEPVFGTKAREASDSYSMEDYEIRYENQLREVLEQVVGLSDVSVMINLAETERSIYEKNTNTKKQNTDETDREGGTRKVEDESRDEQLVIIRNGDKEEPILTYKEKPEIRGVLVVAKGVENAQIKGWVVEAVSRVLDVPSHRVSVMPKKTKEDL